MSRRDINKQAAAAASIAVRELIYHDKNTSRHFLLKIFHFQRLKGKGQFDENLYPSSRLGVIASLKWFFPQIS